MTNAQTTTDVFRVSAGTYMRIVLSRWIKHNLWWLILPPVICLILAATVAVTFIYVALIMMFLLYPMSMMIVYFNYALSPEVCAEISLHKVTFNNNELIIDYLKSLNDDKENIEYVTTKSIAIPYSRVYSYIYSDTSIIIFTDKRGYKLHYIPTTAMTQKCHESACELMEKSRV